jgi:hypothetical protein
MSSVSGPIGIGWMRVTKLPKKQARPIPTFPRRSKRGRDLRAAATRLGLRA